ncbi:MAG: hypothetical protein LEGION0398_MBIBDBAK_00753 [Legionellaceae bacterium]
MKKTLYSNEYTYDKNEENEDYFAKKLSIGKLFWVKVLLEGLSGFGNGFLFRTIIMAFGIFLAIGSIATASTWVVPAIIISVTFVLGIILGVFYARDQYKISDKKNRQELNFLIKNNQLKKTLKKIKKLLKSSSKQEKITVSDYTNENLIIESNFFNQYIYKREKAEKLNDQLRTELNSKEKEYCQGYYYLPYEPLKFKPTITDHDFYLEKPSPTEFNNIRRSKKMNHLFLNLKKEFFYGSKQAINYMGLPLGIGLSLITSIISFTGLLPPIGIVLLTLFIALTMVTGLTAFCYHVFYERPQEKKLVLLQKENIYLKKKYRHKKKQLNEQLDFLVYENKILQKHIKQLEKGNKIKMNGSSKSNSLFMNKNKIKNDSNVNQQITQIQNSYVKEKVVSL